MAKAEIFDGRFLPFRIRKTFLGRDFKSVHEDVTALEAIGLVEREGGLLRADCDEIRASILLDAPAA
jgi:predicted transcriptional regulator